MLVLGLAGRAGAGKDEVANYLVRRYGFIKFSFADGLRREITHAYGLADAALLENRAVKETPSERLALGACGDSEFITLALSLGIPHVSAPISPRWLQQAWGTEYRRAQDPDYWVKQAQDFVFGVRALFDYPEQAPQLFVNTSVRFENERAWVRKMGGNVWHIHRDNTNAVAEHVSEAPLPVLPPERELWNNYTLEYLHKGVEQLLNTDARFVRMEPPLPVERHPIELDVTSE